MTKFQMIGTNLQETAFSKEEAMARKDYSCRLCAGRGLQYDCDSCPINSMHKLVISVFEDLAVLDREKGVK